MFYNRNKLINLFAKERQACACSHLRFAGGEFLAAVLLRPWKSTGGSLPAPDVCWSWVVCLSVGPFGDLRGEHSLASHLHLVWQSEPQVPGKFLLCSTVLLWIVLWLTVTAQVSSR